MKKQQFYDRFINLREWGYNVPTHVESPYQKFGESVLTNLKEIFCLKYGFWIFIENISKKTENLIKLRNISDVGLIIYSYGRRNYRILVMEAPPAPYEENTFYSFDKGYHITFKNEKYDFVFPEELPNTVLRYIARRLCSLSKHIPYYYEIPYIWASDFAGVKNERLILYTYKIFK